MKMKLPSVHAKLLLPCLVLVANFGSVIPAYTEAETYPLRAKYPDDKTISTAELTALADKPILVDVRPKDEFDVIHIKGSVNIDLNKLLEKDLEAVRGKGDARPLVFYCNGIDCEKSYKAAMKARLWGFQNVFIYDDGIFTWGKTNPSATVFLGETLTGPDKLIPEATFEKALLPKAEFLAKAQSGEYFVIDLRSKDERSDVKVPFDGVRAIPFDQVATLLRQPESIIPKSKVLVIDNVGKQVRWLQYYFEKGGRTDYFFAKGGAAALAK